VQSSNLADWKEVGLLTNYFGYVQFHRSSTKGSAFYKTVQTAFPLISAEMPPAPVFLSELYGGTLLYGASAPPLVVLGGGVEITWLRRGEPEVAENWGRTLGSNVYQVIASNVAGSTRSLPATVNVIEGQVESYRAAILSEEGLLAYYPFDQEGADLLRRYDSAVLNPYISGKGINPTNNVISLGASLFVEHADALNFPTGEGSIEAWVQIWPQTVGERTLFAARNHSEQPPENPPRWEVTMAPETRGIAIKTAAGSSEIRVSGRPGQWHHLTLVFDQGHCSIFWDGELAGRVPAALVGSASFPVFIVGAGEPFGWIDELAFYNKALSTEKVRKHFEHMMGVRNN
jgi:hypothetical protein